MKAKLFLTVIMTLFLFLLTEMARAEEPPRTYHGRYIQGTGDSDYLQLLDFCARMYHPDFETQNISMLYTDEWNGFVEGPTWNAWWIQNSYGTSYCQLPFIEEPYVTFQANAQNLWFEWIGDGRKKGAHDWVAPDGQLCDCASPNRVVYKQGDGRIDIHDWGVEFTAAAIVMQSEMLLIGRDKEKIDRYLPLLRRSMEFIESRHDKMNGLYLVGPAGNLLAPNYAGWKREDGSFGMAYLTGLSINAIAALDRMIELEKLAGFPDRAKEYAERRDAAWRGLAKLTTDEGYFIKSLDPDGTRHGVVGAEKYGYFDAVCNHDAVAFRVADDAQSRKIYEKIASLPGLRPYDLIITNWPNLDDTYMDQHEGLWKFGRWVDGGHWTTCEARMILTYFRVGAYEDARRSMRIIEKLARNFKTDNPLSEFGSKPYQPDLDINCVYDTWGAPAAMLRGLYEYVYSADSLTLFPHIPNGVTQLIQRFPIRFGTKRLFISASGNGPVQKVFVDGKPWTDFNAKSVTLAFDALSEMSRIHLVLAGGSETIPKIVPDAPPLPTDNQIDSIGQSDLCDALRATRDFYMQLQKEGLENSYLGAHARLVLDYVGTILERQKRLADGTLAPLPKKTQAAADRSYFETMKKLLAGLQAEREKMSRSVDKQ